MPFFGANHHLVTTRGMRVVRAASAPPPPDDPFAAERTYFNKFSDSLNVFGGEWTIPNGEWYVPPPSPPPVPSPDGLPALHLGPYRMIYSATRMDDTPPFLDFAHDWTFEAWFLVYETAIGPYTYYPPGSDEPLTGDGYFSVLRNDFGFNNESRYSIAFTDNNTTWFRNAYSIQWGSPDWETGEENGAYTPANSLPIGRWFHLAFVVDGLNKRIFIDGSLAATGTLNSKGSGSGFWQMGHTHDGYCGMNVCVRNFQLTQAAKYSADFTPTWRAQFVPAGKAVQTPRCDTNTYLSSNGRGGAYPMPAGLAYGCNDPTATNYDPNAQCDDGSCDYIYGCTDPNANNYHPSATRDNGGCCYNGAYNTVQCVDCDVAIVTVYDSCGYPLESFAQDPEFAGGCFTYGCSDENALNYLENAQCESNCCYPAYDVQDLYCVEYGGILTRIYIDTCGSYFEFVGPSATCADCSLYPDFCG